MSPSATPAQANIFAIPAAQDADRSSQAWRRNVIERNNTLNFPSDQPKFVVVEPSTTAPVTSGAARRPLVMWFDRARFVNN